MRLTLLPLLLLSLLACAEPAPTPAAPPAGASPAVALSAAAPAPASGLKLTVTPIALPGATGAVSLDYLAIDRAAGEVWIPAGDTASVDVLETATRKITRIDGFPTVEREVRGSKRLFGPSSATAGASGWAYVGNRGDAQVCGIGTGGTYTRGGCARLPFAPDGLQYVAATKELWATTPKDNSIHVIDASTPGRPGATPVRIALDGGPEGYAVDEGRGIFYTNLEDKDKTVVLDARTHKVTATWDARCGGDGPRGLALDAQRGFLFVACTDRVQVVDTAHGGAKLSELATGEGVDNIDYVDASRQLYVAAGKAGTLTVARVGDNGTLTVIGTTPTAPGARVVVAGADGTAYVADGKQGRVLVVTAAKGP